MSKDSPTRRNGIPFPWRDISLVTMEHHTVYSSDYGVKVTYYKRTAKFSKSVSASI